MQFKKNVNLFDEFDINRHNLTTIFECKRMNRYIAFLLDDNGNNVIPHYAIKRITRPKNKTITFYCYEPMGENIYFKLLIKTWNRLLVRELDAVGDVAEQWCVTGCELIDIESDDLDWSNNGEPSTIKVISKFNEINVKGLNLTQL